MQRTRAPFSGACALHPHRHFFDLCLIGQGSVTPLICSVSYRGVQYDSNCRMWLCLEQSHVKIIEHKLRVITSRYPTALLTLVGTYFGVPSLTGVGWVIVTRVTRVHKK